MSGPRRFQRSRKAGAKLPAGVVCVTRPGRWGNPYPTAWDFRCAMLSVAYGKPMTAEREKHRETVLAIYQSLEELRGKDLACWCPLNQECHADVLIEFANRRDVPAIVGRRDGSGEESGSQRSDSMGNQE